MMQVDASSVKDAVQVGVVQLFSVDIDVISRLVAGMNRTLPDGHD
jgi:hypothetical protein